MSRTPEQFAIEHGRILADAARHLMDVLNKEAIADGNGEEPDAGARTDAWCGLNDAIYEFEKRADRAYPKPSS